MIARLQKPQQNSIEPFGAIARKDDIVGSWSVEQAGCSRATLLQGS